MRMALGHLDTLGSLFKADCFRETQVIKCVNETRRRRSNAAIGQKDNLSRGPLVKIFVLLICMMSTQTSVYGAGPSFLPSAEVIVKFKHGTRADKLVNSILSGSAPTTEQINRYMDQLSREISLPLTYRQVTSGKEMVLGINDHQVLEQLKQAIADKPGIRRVEVISPSPHKPSPRPYMTLRISFKECGENGDSIKRIADELIEAQEYAVISKIEPPVLMIQLDHQKELKRLVQKLKRRPDVEYVQPNLLMKHFQ